MDSETISSKSQNPLETYIGTVPMCVINAGSKHKKTLQLMI